MIDGTMDRPARRAIIAAFKSGEIRALTSCDVLTTGFNVPAVDVVALVRPTQSTALYVQIIGRGMRTAPGGKQHRNPQ
jgi:DNA repair protein RadD